MMKKIIVLIAILFVFQVILADDLEIRRENVTWSVAFYITVDGSGEVPSGANNTFSGTPGEVPPVEEICSYRQNGLFFATWFTDMSDGGNPSAVMVPGDDGSGHSYWGDVGGFGYYGFNMGNFYTADRTEVIEYDGSLDTLHVRLMYIDESLDTFVWAIDDVFTSSSEVEAITATLEPTPHALWNRDTYECFPLSIYEERPTTTPTEYEIAQNSPNPFNTTTSIDYTIPEHANVSLDVFDISGRHIKGLVNENLNSGRYTVEWDGTDESGNTVPSGTYFYKIKAGDYEAERKMLLVK